MFKAIQFPLIEVFSELGKQVLNSNYWMRVTSARTLTSTKPRFSIVPNPVLACWITPSPTMMRIER